MTESILDIKVHEESEIHCSDCNTLLARFFTTTSPYYGKENNQKNQYVVVDCFACHGRSMPSKILHGRAYINAAYDGFKMQLVDTEVKDNVIITTIKIVKG